MEIDEEIREKLEEYEKMVEARRRGASITNSISPEARRERARKAVQARWEKYRKTE